MNDETRYKIGMKVSKVTIVWNVILSIAKIIAGIIGKSNAMLADGVHTLSDIISTIVVMLGIRMAKKPADEDHPYGHEKIEPVMAKILAILLLAVAFGIGYNGIKLIVNRSVSEPGMIAIYAAVSSIAVKEWMYWYTIKASQKIESPALCADAWHHRSDVFSSVGTLIGIAGAKLGCPILDPIAALIVCIFIVKVGINIYLQAVKQLIDTSASPEVICQIQEIVLKTEGVISLEVLKTRMHANKIYVDIEIGVNSNLSLKEAHSIAENVHDNVEKYNEKVKHCTVHVNPVE